MSHSVNGYVQQAWRLDDLFPALQAPEIEAAVTELKELLAAMEEFRPKLLPTLEPAAFQALLALYEQTTRTLYRLYAFGSLSFAQDTQNQAALTYLGRMQQLSAESQNRLLFFELWWKELDDANAARLQAAAGDFRYWLDSLRREKPYTLSEAEERIVNLKNVNGRQAMDQLYDAITNRYTFKLTIDGQEQELTRAELSTHYRSADPSLRQAAFDELLRVYAQDAPILGQIYHYIVRDWQSEFIRLRRYNEPIAVRNLSNDIPDAVVDTLLTVAQANAGLFQRYFRLKARWLNLKRLRRYDLSAPVAVADKNYSFGESVHLVLDSFEQFDPRLAALAQRVFDDRHYDSEVRKGKMGGAFCATVTPALTPWVLQSFNGKPEDVATMAHELGHAIHAMLAEHHTALTQHSSLPLAETASTFGEMLLVNVLLATDPDPAVQRALLFKQMDDAYSTVMRQIYFALFERTAHARVSAGASVNDLCALYLANLHEQFGDAVEIGDNFQYEWVAIPHIYGTPFYVYAYAFGQLLVYALYRQFRQEGEPFKARYLNILSAGGAEAPVEILKQAGIDVYSAEFWQGGFDVIGELLAQLEALPLP